MWRSGAPLRLDGVRSLTATSTPPRKFSVIHAGVPPDGIRSVSLSSRVLSLSASTAKRTANSAHNG